MAIDRSKFKTSSSVAMKQQDDEIDATIKNREVFADKLEITNGINKFRIFPYHPDGGGDVYAETKVVHWLPAMMPEKDNGKVVLDSKGQPKMKKTSRPIFNSKIHGGTDKDVIEEYISFANKLAEDTYGKDEDKKKSFLEPIIGNFNKKVQGILAKQAWVIYANKIDKDNKSVFGRLEFGKAVKYRLNAIAASESSSEPLGTDPFTDIEDGRAIVITYNKEATKPADFYTTEIDSSFDKATKKINLYPLTDEELDKFEKYPSLASMFKNSYKKKDFNLALEGLKMFDDEHELGIFAHDEFLDIVDSISNYYPEESEEKEEGRDSKVPEVKGDMFDQMDRSELKGFIKDNETGFIVKPSIVDDMIRDHLREWSAAQEEPKAVEKEEVEEEEEEEESDVIDKVATNDLPWEQEGEEIEKPSTSAKDRVAEMRAKLAAKKK